MTIKELIEELRRYPEDLQVLYRRYSDYMYMERDDITIGPAVVLRPSDGWLTRVHPSMTPKELATKRDYLIFPGN